MGARLFRTENKMNLIEAHRPSLSKQELVSVLDCLINDRLGSGKLVERFEKTFASTFNFGQSLAVNSLTSAYHLALLSLSLEPGTPIIMSALAPVQALDAAKYVHAAVHLLDVDRDSFHPSADSLAKALEEIGRDASPIFILDHSFGSVYQPDRELLDSYKVRVVEDFSGVVGSDIHGEFSGKFGPVSVCGLSETDLLTTAMGAILAVNEAALYPGISSLRYGGKRKPGQEAYDYRIGDFQAAMGMDQLARLGVTVARRRKIGRKYLDALRSSACNTYFKHPDIDGYLKFLIIAPGSQEEALRYFRSLRIGAVKGVDYALHHLLEKPRLEFPNAERMFQKSIAIPTYPALTANNVERVAASLRGLI